MSALIISLLVLISIILIIILTTSLKLHAFIALFIVSVFLAFATLPAKTIITTIKEGFGGTMGSIGFLIIFGAIIGITLDKTGGTISIANYILSKTGEKRSAAGAWHNRIYYRITNLLRFRFYNSERIWQNPSARERNLRCLLWLLFLHVPFILFIASSPRIPALWLLPEYLMSISDI